MIHIIINSVIWIKQNKLWVYEREMFPKNEGSRIWHRLWKIIKTLSEQNELRYGGGIDCEKFRKYQSMQLNYSSVILKWQ